MVQIVHYRVTKCFATLGQTHEGSEAREVLENISMDFLIDEWHDYMMAD